MESEKKKAIATMVYEDVEMQIKGTPEDIKSFLREHEFPDFIQTCMNNEVDYLVNHGKED